MGHRSFVRVGVVLLGVALAMPLPVSAQQASGIAGGVSDDTGGVLPGVTVEAASPALIEQIRTVFTDGEESCRSPSQCVRVMGWTPPATLIVATMNRPERPKRRRSPDAAYDHRRRRRKVGLSSRQFAHAPVGSMKNID